MKFTESSLLYELSPNNTGKLQFGVSIAVKTSWICLDLLQHETSAGVDTICHNSCREGTGDSALGASVIVVAFGLGKAR